MPNRILDRELNFSKSGGIVEWPGVAVNGIIYKGKL